MPNSLCKETERTIDMKRHSSALPGSGSSARRVTRGSPALSVALHGISVATLVLTVLVTSACASKIPANQWTRIAASHYPGMTDIHQEVNVIEGIYEGQRISGYIDLNDEWVELSRRPVKAIDAAEAGQIADVVTTGIGLSQGLAETNPLGVGILPLKIALNQYAENQGVRECGQIKSFLSATGWGATAANIVTISAGAFTGGSAAAGFLVGTLAWNQFPGTDGCSVWLGQPVELSTL
jgi:hypothetical protein